MNARKKEGINYCMPYICQYQLKYVLTELHEFFLLFLHNIMKASNLYSITDDKLMRKSDFISKNMWL